MMKNGNYLRSGVNLDIAETRQVMLAPSSCNLCSRTISACCLVSGAICHAARLSRIPSLESFTCKPAQKPGVRHCRARSKPSCVDARIRKTTWHAALTSSISCLEQAFVAVSEALHPDDLARSRFYQMAKRLLRSHGLFEACFFGTQGWQVSISVRHSDWHCSWGVWHAMIIAWGADHDPCNP